MNMSSKRFEEQILALCEVGGSALLGGHTNHQIALLFVRFAEANEFRQTMVKRGWTYADGWVERDTTSPYHTGSDDALPEYMQKSFAASRRMFEAGHRDESLHHRILALEESGVLIPNGFIQLPSQLFGSGEVHTLFTQAKMCAELLNENVVNGTDAKNLIAQLPVPATDPNLVREGPRNRADLVPSIICGVEEYQGGLPLWRIAEHLGTELRHSPAPDWLPDEAYNNRGAQEGFKPLAPRRNCMTVNEALWYATHCEEAAGKRIVALASWQGGAVFDAYRPKARFIPEGVGAPKTGLQIEEGSGASNLTMRNRDKNGKLIPECGRFIEIDCREERQIAIRPIDVNAINGRDSLVVLTFASILRSGELLPDMLLMPPEETAPMIEETAITEEEIQKVQKSMEELDDGLREI